MTKFRYYYENICVSFASLRLFNPLSSLVLFTTKEVPEVYFKILRDLKVDIQYVKVRYILQNDETNKFLGSLFLLDCISTQKRNTLYLDPDVICLSSLEDLQLNEDTILVYDAQDFVENKVSIQKISTFVSANSISTINEIKYCGGEFFFIPQKRVEEIKNNIKKIWKTNKNSKLSIGECLQTEEHFLTLAIHNLHSVETTNSISRLWTTRTYRRIPKNYSELILIHLPAEKDNGISKLFEMIFHDQELPDLRIFSSANKEKLFKTLNISKNLCGSFQFRFLRFLKLTLNKIRF